ncbi:NAD(P)-dependent oxidoreductase [Furfurilactobacillus siliginis]|uniref:Flavin reductase n=1 Tax=Furfurilactobacillus siliginis TaxID=348151 RepID=A0A0R2L6F1_9LACO|nr:NAD(P)H-binding protein [Furfurilactobacillus siliginis]KRN97138.1 NADH-flavin reductase [Furfurilactobacillus siliginis]GEK29504.1 flavin reductase [Furfurilactobacillus siliginis]
MKIGIIGATGKAGNLILTEARSRHIDVLAIVRDHHRLQQDVPYLEKEIADLTTDDIEDLDVLVSAYGAPRGEGFRYPEVMQHLIDIVKGTTVRLLVIGGAGSLFTTANRTGRLYDEPNFPESFKDTSTNMGAALQLLQTSEDVDWTYISPARNFVFTGTKTGKYQLGADFLSFNAQGQSEISYADYAVAFVDEIQNHQHPYQHISVVSR